MSYDVTMDGFCVSILSQNLYKLQTYYFSQVSVFISSHACGTCQPSLEMYGVLRCKENCWCKDRICCSQPNISSADILLTFVTVYNKYKAVFGRCHRCFQIIFSADCISADIRKYLGPSSYLQPCKMLHDCWAFFFILYLKRESACEEP